MRRGKLQNSIDLAARKGVQDWAGEISGPFIFDAIRILIAASLHATADLIEARDITGSDAVTTSLANMISSNTV